MCECVFCSGKALALSPAWAKMCRVTDRADWKSHLVMAVASA